MANQFFIDTSAFLALKNCKDQHHDEAVEVAHYILEETRKTGLTTDYVLDETYTLISRRVGRKAAVEFGEDIRRGSEMSIVYLTKNLLERAWQFFKKYQDKKLSFTDCTSFVVMKEHRIREAFTFDKHFEQVGFKTAIIS